MIAGLSTQAHAIVHIPLPSECPQWALCEHRVFEFPFLPNPVDQTLNFSLKAAGYRGGMFPVGQWHTLTLSEL